MGKRFKLYLEIPTPVGTNTCIRLDKLPGFEDIIDPYRLAQHLVLQIEERRNDPTKKLDLMPIVIGQDRFNELKRAISTKQKHLIGWYVIVSDGSRPLVQVMAEMPKSEEE